MQSNYVVLIGLLAVSLLTVCATAAGNLPDAAVSAYIITDDKEPFTCYDALSGKDVTMKRLNVYAAESYDLHLNLYWASERNVVPTDEFVLTFRELFSGTTAQYTENVVCGFPIDNIRTGMLMDMHVTPEKIQLRPGFYHLRVDLVQDGLRTTESHPGSVYFYLAEEDESLGHITASYWVGHFSFLIDPETNALISVWPIDAPIPASWDPFDPATRDVWLAAHQACVAANPRRQMLRSQKGIGELVGDCGQGLAFAWYAFHAMGEKDRAQYTHDLFNRATCNRLFKDDMVAGDDYFLISWNYQAARMVAQACVLFHDDPEYGQWAEETFDTLSGWMYEKYRVMKMAHHCVVPEEGVYTGRVFAGKAFFQLAHFLFREKPYPSEVDGFQDLLAYAVDEAEFLIEHDGHYLDPGNPGYLKKCGNVNMACGFAPMLHLARETGHEEEAEILAKGLRILMHAASSYDSRPAGWMRGDAYLICEMVLRLLGDDPLIAAYRDDCMLSGDFMPAAEQRYNGLTVLLLNSPEWRRVVESGKDWRLLRGLPKPEPMSWREDFEKTAVGESPEVSLLFTTEHPETLAVSDETAASGRHSLKFIDGSSDQPYYEPELAYDLNFTEGIAVLRFDLRLEPGAVFRSDLRDERGINGVGPSVVFDHGTLRVGDRELTEVPEGQWFHVEIEAGLAGAANGTFAIAITLPDQDPKRFKSLPCQRQDFFQAHRCFLSAYATEEAVFYLDNIHIEERLRSSDPG